MKLEPRQLLQHDHLKEGYHRREAGPHDGRNQNEVEVAAAQDGTSFSFSGHGRFRV